MNSHPIVGVVGSFDWDLKTGRAVWTKGMFEIFDVSRAKFDGSLEAAFERVHPNDRQRLRHVTDLSLKDGIPRPLQYRGVRPGGEIRTVSAVAESYYGKTDEALGMIGTVRDVTEEPDSEKENAEVLVAALAALTLAAPLLPRDSEADVAAAKALHLLLRALH